MTQHAVSRLKDQRLARSAKPFVARGSRSIRCAGCRLILSHCLCALQPLQTTRAGVCLIMGDIEALKPSNTGWLVADVVRDTMAFGWSRTEVDAELIALLQDPQWQPYLVFPGDYMPPERVVTEVRPHAHKRPLFVLLDGTWAEGRKMARKSPYLDALPVLSLQPEQLSRYHLRSAARDHHLCTAEVAAACLVLAGEVHAADMLEAYLQVFTQHYLSAKRAVPADWDDLAHRALNAVQQRAPAKPVTSV